MELLYIGKIGKMVLHIRASVSILSHFGWSRLGNTSKDIGTFLMNIDSQ